MVTEKNTQATGNSDVTLQASRVLEFLSDINLKPDADGNISMPRSQIHTVSWEFDINPLREADAINVSRGSPDPTVTFRVKRLEELAGDLREQGVESSSFEKNENKRVARVAVGFLAQFSEQAFKDGYALIPPDRVKGLLSDAQMDRLVKIGALQEKPDATNPAKKCVFNITRLEELAGDRWDKIIKAGRECP